MALAPILIQIVTQGTSQAVQNLHSLTTAAQGVGPAANSAASGLNTVGPAASNAGTAVSAAAQQVDALRDRMERMRNIGAGITAAAAGVLAISANFRQTNTEGAGAEARINAVFAAQKRLNDLPKVERAIGDIAERGHFNDDDGMRQSAVLLANWEVKAKDMPGLLEAAGRQAQTTGQNMEELANSFGKAVATGNYEGLKRSAVSFSDVEIAAIKAGYAISQEKGQLELVNSITAAVARTTGELGASLTDAEKASNDAARGWDDFSTTVGEGANAAHTAIQKDVLIPLLSIGNAHPGLLKAAGGVLEIGGSVGAIAGPMIGLAGQIGLMRIGFAGMGASSLAAFQSMAAGAMSAAPAIWGALAPVAVVLGEIVAVALLAAAALYALDKATHYKEDQELKKNIEAGDATDNERLDMVNEERAKKHKKAITLEQLKAWESDETGQMDPDGPQSKENDPSADIDEMKKQLADLQSGKTPATPAMPAGPTMPMEGMPAAPGLGTSGMVALPGASVANATAGASDENPYEAQIRELTRKKRDLKGKENAAARDALQAQIDSLQDSSRQWNEAHKNAVASQKANDRASGQKAQDAADLRRIQLQNASDAKIGPLEDALEKARDANDAKAIESLTLQIELAKAQEAREEALAKAALEADGEHKTSLIQQANAIYEGAAAAASRTAQRAGRIAKSSGERGGKDSSSDAAVRAQLNMQRIASPSLGFPALDPGANAGDRFAGLEPSLFRGAATVPQAPVNRFSEGINQSVAIARALQRGGQVGGGISPQYAGLGSSDRTGAGANSGPRQVNLNIKASTKQAANGDIEVTLNADKIIIPYMGISNTEGQF